MQHLPLVQVLQRPQQLQPQAHHEVRGQTAVVGAVLQPALQVAAGHVGVGVDQHGGGAVPGRGKQGLYVLVSLRKFNVST